MSYRDVVCKTWHIPPQDVVVSLKAILRLSTTFDWSTALVFREVVKEHIRVIGAVCQI